MVLQQTLLLRSLLIVSVFPLQNAELASSAATQKDHKGAMSEIYKALLGLVAELQTGLRLTGKMADDCAAKSYFASKARKIHDHFGQLNEDLVDLATKLDTRKKGRRATEERISKLAV